MFTIYSIFSKSKNKVIYVGCTENKEKRFYDHLRGFKHSYKHYKNMYELFNEEDIKINVLEESNITNEEAIDKEKYWINYYNTCEDGYNSAPYGHASVLGLKLFTDKQKEERSKKMKENNPMKNKDTVDKMKEGLKKYWTKEKREEASIRNTGRKHIIYVDHYQGKKIFMYNKNNILEKEFDSIRQALNYLGLIGHAALYKAIKNKTLYKGYYWKK